MAGLLYMPEGITCTNTSLACWRFAPKVVLYRRTGKSLMNISRRLPGTRWNERERGSFSAGTAQLWPSAGVNTNAVLSTCDSLTVWAQATETIHYSLWQRNYTLGNWICQRNVCEYRRRDFHDQHVTVLPPPPPATLCRNTSLNHRTQQLQSSNNPQQQLQQLAVAYATHKRSCQSALKDIFSEKS